MIPCWTISASSFLISSLYLMGTSSTFHAGLMVLRGLSWCHTLPASVKAVGIQCLKVLGTVIAGCTWFHIDGIESWSWGWFLTWGLLFLWLCLLCCLIWNDSTHLMNMDHVSRIEIFNSIWDGLERSQFLCTNVRGLERTWYILTDGLEMTHFLTFRGHGHERGHFWYFFLHFDIWSGKKVFYLFRLFGSLVHLVHEEAWYWKNMLAGVLKGTSVHVYLSIVMKELNEGSWNDSDSALCFLCGVLLFNLFNLFNLWSWKEPLELLVSLFSIAKTDLEMSLQSTHTRLNLVLAGMSMMISLGIHVSTT